MAGMAWGPWRFPGDENPGRLRAGSRGRAGKAVEVRALQEQGPLGAGTARDLL